MIIENLDFNQGSSDILQYIPQVPDQQQPENNNNEMPQSMFGLPSELQPSYQSRTLENPPELFKVEIKPPLIQNDPSMEFSTAISDVIPSAEFAAAPLSGPYKDPQTQRVTGLSLDNASIGPKPSSGSSKNPFGLNDEQLYATFAGISAVLAFSKPVQNKLSTLVPQFLSSSGDVTTVGLAITAFIAAVFFYILNKMVKQKS